MISIKRSRERGRIACVGSRIVQSSYCLLSVMTSLSLIPCNSSSDLYDRIFFLFAALSVPARDSNVLATLSSLNNTPKVVV